jgi:hypothetical protein
LIRSTTAALGICLAATGASAEDTERLANQLSNPVASLISVPFQGNWNGDIGPAEKGQQVYWDLQPVVPFAISDDLTIISRTIMPIVWQEDIFPGAGMQFSPGNITQSLFLVPRTVNGFSVGLGPVFWLPLMGDPLIAPEQLGFGPTGVWVWQGKGWTVGTLANHIWSVAGDPAEPAYDQTYLQPFVAYSSKDAWTFSANSESYYNWESSEWTVPVNIVVSKIVDLHGQHVQLFAGARYWIDTPEEAGPQGWGARFGFTFLFPEK